jgi:putative membrane protein
MNLIAQIFALVGAAVHVLAFVWETLLFRRPAIHRDLFRLRTEDLPATLLWSFNVGFYNLFLGSGAVAGVLSWWSGNATVGRTLVVYTCSFMFLAGIALAISDRLALSRERGAGVLGAISQSVPPLVALVAVALGS